MFIFSLIDLHRLSGQQWLKPEELEEIQRRKLRRMIKHAYENVPYYRKLFDSAGVRPEDIKTVADMAGIPITTRLQLQKLPQEEVLAKGTELRKCKKLKTAGSSGIPLNVVLRKEDNEYYGIVWARTSLAAGQRLWDRPAYLKFQFPPRLWFEHLGIWRKNIISLLKDSDDKLEVLRKVRPDVLRGNAFELVGLARTVKEKGVKGVNPRLVFSMGSLLDKESRELIESALGAEVYDFYGATELGCIAWECSEHKGHHINSDTLVMEFIKDGRPAQAGEMGRIICTGLHSFAMPFIRYDTGDVGIASDEKCPCGRGLPLLKSLEGRTDDFLVSQKGDLHSPSAIVNQVKSVPGLSQFRIVQESIDSLSIQVARGEGFSERTVEGVRETIHRIMGDDIKISLEVVDAIPPDPSGKRRSLISKVRRDRL